MNIWFVYKYSWWSKPCSVKISSISHAKKLLKEFSMKKDLDYYGLRREPPW